MDVEEGEYEEGGYPSLLPTPSANSLRGKEEVIDKRTCTGNN